MKVQIIEKTYIVVAIASIMILSCNSKEHCNIINNDILQPSRVLQGQSIGIDNYNFVDLGLTSGTLWSACNIGTRSPYDIGAYFAWGEIASKDKYNWETYKYYMEDKWSLRDEPIIITKYNCHDSIGKHDDKSMLEYSDDAAYMNSGGLCKIPSSADWKELMTECKRSVIEMNGVKGSKIEGPNGNFIFIPNTGYYAENKCKNETGGFYWTSDLEMDGAWNSCFAHCAVFGKGYGINKEIRFVGMPIRPIKK